MSRRTPPQQPSDDLAPADSRSAAGAAGPHAPGAASPHAPGAAPRRRPSRWRKALLQLLGTAAFLVLLEGLLALLGVQPLAADSDPYVGFAGHLPLFVETTGADGRPVMVTAPGKLKVFNAQEFPRDKPPGTFRIVTLGGSTVYGHPFDDKASFSAWLRELLPTANPSRRWEVINCGGISYASYREVVVLQEMLQYGPDLVIVYSGPNEFLEQRTYGDLGQASPLLLTLGSVVSRTRIFSLARTLLHREATDDPAGAGTARSDATSEGAPADVGARRAASADGAGARSRLSAEVSTLLERPAGLSLYHRDDALRERVLQHFRFNLTRMAALCREAGTRVLFVTPASELRDCAPFKSEHGAGLSAEDAALVDGLLTRASELGGSDPAAARALLEQAVARDPRHAESQYRLGEAQFAAGDFAAARASLERARDEDVCPLRPLGVMRDIVREVAASSGSPALDFVQLVDDDCERRFGHRVPGREQFLDHVHLDADGYGLLGRALFDRLAADGVVRPDAAWGPEALAAAGARVSARLDAQARGFALRNLAKTLGWAGKRDEAERLAQQTLEALGDGDSESHFLLGNFALHDGRFERAIAEYRRATEIDPDYAEAWLNLADALIKARRGGEALAPLERTLALDPSQAQAWNIAGLLLDGAGRQVEALQHFERALELAPDDSQVHNNHALALLHADRPDEAIAALRRSIELDPAYAQAHYNLGLLLRRQDRFEEAVQQFQRALAIDPGYAKAAAQLQELAGRASTGAGQ